MRGDVPEVKEKRRKNSSSLERHPPSPTMRSISTMLGTLVLVPLLYLTAFKEIGFPNSWAELVKLVREPP